MINISKSGIIKLLVAGKRKKVIFKFLLGMKTL